jgi:TonB family protein
MSSKTRSILGSVIIHAILLVLLLLFGFRTPLPLPAEQGILINFGTSDQGSGIAEPKPAVAASNETAKQTPSETVKETPLTQDFEEAATIPTPKPVVKPKPETKPKPKPVETVKPQNEQPKPVEEKPREVNQQALFPGQKPGGSNTGEGETGNPGNQGSVDGSTESNSHIGGPVGGGDGISFSLGGRSRLSLPSPEYPKQKSGRVVVEVTVDRNGNVTKATGGVKGSTTTDIDLVKAAERAALLAKFNVKSDAPAEQIGTITYVFRLQQ